MLFVHPRPIADPLILFQCTPSLVGYFVLTTAAQDPTPGSTAAQLYNFSVSWAQLHIQLSAFSLEPTNRTPEARCRRAERIDTGAKYSPDAGAARGPAPGTQVKLLCEEGFPGNEGRASLFPCIPRSPAEGRHGRPRTPQPGTAAVPSPAWLRGSPALPLPSSRPHCFRSPTRETAFSFFRPPEVILYQVGNKAFFFFFFSPVIPIKQ